MPRGTAARIAPSAPSPIEQRPAALSPWGHLILIGFQIKTNLKKAQDEFDIRFRDAIRGYLMTLPPGDHNRREQEVAGIVKVSLVEKGGEPRVNSELVKNTLISAVRNGAIPHADLLTLFEVGALGVVDAERVINLLLQRMPPQTYTVPANPDQIRRELRWQVLAAAAEGGCGVLSDVADRVHQATRASLAAEDLELMRTGSVRATAAAAAAPLVTEVQDPSVVAVRRPRRTRQQQQQQQPPEPQNQR